MRRGGTAQEAAADQNQRTASRRVQVKGAVAANVGPQLQQLLQVLLRPVRLLDRDIRSHVEQPADLGELLLVLVLVVAVVHKEAVRIPRGDLEALSGK